MASPHDNNIIIITSKIKSRLRPCRYNIIHDTSLLPTYSTIILASR